MTGSVVSMGTVMAAPEEDGAAEDGDHVVTGGLLDEVLDFTVVVVRVERCEWLVLVGTSVTVTVMTSVTVVSGCVLGPVGVRFSLRVGEPRDCLATTFLVKVGFSVVVLRDRSVDFFEETGFLLLVEVVVGSVGGMTALRDGLPSTWRLPMVAVREPKPLVDSIKPVELEVLFFVELTGGGQLLVYFELLEIEGFLLVEKVDDEAGFFVVGEKVDEEADFFVVGE